MSAGIKRSGLQYCDGTGSEAAFNAAQIVLLDSDFARMPSVVLEGRRVVNNIQRSASLFLVKNLFSMLMTLFTFVAVSKYPLYPTQLSFWEHSPSVHRHFYWQCSRIKAA